LPGNPDDIVTIAAEPTNDRRIDVLVRDEHSVLLLARDRVRDVRAHGLRGKRERIPNGSFG
jgi:hypothetical protein